MSYQKQKAKYNMHKHVNNRILSLTKQGKDVRFITLCGKDENIHESSLVEAFAKSNKGSLDIVSICKDAGFYYIERQHNLRLSESSECRLIRKTNSENDFFIGFARHLPSPSSRFAFKTDLTATPNQKKQLKLALDGRLKFEAVKGDILRYLNDPEKHENKKKTHCVIFLDLCGTFLQYVNLEFEKALKEAAKNYQSVDVFFCFSDSRRHKSKSKNSPSSYAKGMKGFEDYEKHIISKLTKSFKKPFFHYSYVSESSRAEVRMTNIGISIKGRSPAFVSHGRDNFRPAPSLPPSHKDSETYKQNKLIQKRLAKYRHADNSYSKTRKQLAKILSIDVSSVAGQKAALSRSINKGEFAL